MDVISLIRIAKSMGASDLHLSVSSPPIFRVQGVLRALEGDEPLKAEDMEQAFNQLTTEKERETFHKSLELDFGYTLSGAARVRCNVALQRGTISMVMRLIPAVIPGFADLRLPDICKELVLKPRGFFVVSGPTGSGKSTTLAAMVDFLNHTESRRIVTVEDPIEYVYTNDKCVITQRELGGDTVSFVEALRHVLRQNPDVILVGEIRDVETAAAALTIAETGHMVMTTGHAPSTYQAIERIIDLFPPYERPQVQSRLASLINAIMCQALVPKADGKGRVPAVEIMLANSAVRNLIREGKIHQLPNVIRTHARMGMQLLDHALIELYRKGLISIDSLYAFCNDREEVDKLLKHGDEVLAR
ncbi:MAG: PilT/PilU family type 4a pilus ATPase [Dehalococcoidia bacterium]|nr:PilT/PilU family type 4a pilus ATPase [Dehalococcoidia bacterium]